MKRYIYIFIFIMSLFFSVNIVNVDADYEAAALNPVGATCNLVNNSTGYCFYANANLNSVNYMKYLDTGDVVTVLTSYDKVPSKDRELCPGDYVYVSQFYTRNNKTYYGYYCETYLTTGEIPDDKKEELRNLGFPESYWSKLYIMMQAHPNWQFRAINTNLDFNTAALNESYGSRSLLRASMSNNYAYLSTNENSFDYHNDSFIAYDDTDGANPWYLVNYDTVAYYLDPRNFLSDMYVFQFQTLSYDSSVSDEDLKTNINTILGNAYISKFVDTFIEAGKISLVNPIYLATLSKQEVGSGTSPSTAIAGTYNGMYNFYNIGASSGASPAINGLKFAANNDSDTLRPWNTEYKAIIGGAKWIYNNYLYHGQDTSYFKKFNVVHDYLVSIGRTPKYSNYAHQYMQNIQAPSSEGTTTYRSYSKNNMLDFSYTFYIPVYNNMPNETSLPTNGGWPNNYLSSLKINDKKVAEFDSEVEIYNYNLDINNPTIKLEASSISNKATINGTGTFNIEENTTKEIKVTAQNGNVKTYKINITLVGELLEEPVDVQTTLNNAGIKNGDKYITGIALNTNIDVIKAKILNANENAVAVLKDSSGNTKENAIIVTGDKLSITVNNETKEYEFVIYGDISGDGAINALDFIKIKKYMLNDISLSGAYFEAGDITKDGAINALDFIQIRKYMLGSTSAIKQ